MATAVSPELKQRICSFPQGPGEARWSDIFDSKALHAAGKRIEAVAKIYQLASISVLDIDDNGGGDWATPNFVHMIRIAPRLLQYLQAPQVQVVPVHMAPPAIRPRSSWSRTASLGSPAYSINVRWQILAFLEYTEQERDGRLGSSDADPTHLPLRDDIDEQQPLQRPARMLPWALHEPNEYRQRIMFGHGPPLPETNSSRCSSFRKGDCGRLSTKLWRIQAKGKLHQATRVSTVKLYQATRVNTVKLREPVDSYSAGSVYRPSWPLMSVGSQRIR